MAGAPGEPGGQGRLVPQASVLHRGRFRHLVPRAGEAGEVPMRTAAHYVEFNHMRASSSAFGSEKLYTRPFLLV